MSLHGKVAIVTGSGRGLGLAYARELARLGAAVVVNDVDTEVAKAAVDTITADGGRATAVVAPVGPTETADRLVETAVSEFGRLDILVTNAGVLRDTVLWKMSDDDFDTVLNVHLRGTFTCVRAAATHMRAAGEGGRIIAIGSPTGQRGNFGQTNYAAAKAGIVGMVRTWAMELQRAGITVNAVVPVAATAMTETVPFFKDFVDAAAAGEPLPPFARKVLGFGTPEDAASVVGYLASDAAAEVTGQAIGIGGDRLALWSHPTEQVVAIAEDGWSTETISASAESLFGGAWQSVGQPMPKPPADPAAKPADGEGASQKP